MAPFDFKSDMHFVASSDKLTLHVYQLNKSANPSSIRKAHWSEVAIIVPGRDDNDDDYSGLVFFDGHGEIQEPAALTKLAQELTRLRLMVSPEGYCYQDVSEFGELKDFGIHYLRLNDTFDWSHHGVDLATTTVWHRSKLRYHVPKQTKQVGGGSVSKDKYEELKKLLKEKEEELEKVTEEKDDAEEELQRLKEVKQSEMEELKNEKDKELRKLKRERDRAVQKKEEELQRLRKENEELRKLREEKDDKNDDDDDNCDTRRVDEIKLIREEKDEELRKLGKEKDDEMAKLVKEKDEELRKARTRMEEEALHEMDKLKKEKEEELQKLKSQSLKTEADLQQKLEICIQRSWSISIIPNRRNLFPESSHEEKKQFHLTTRRPMPPETFEVVTVGPIDMQMKRHYTPEIKDGSNRLLFETYEIAENEKLETTALWPAPPKVDIGTSDGKFDTRNWWFAKFSAPEGGLTMVAYYDGNFNSVMVSSSTFSQPTIPLPYSKHAAFCPFGRTFVLGGLPVGMRLAFVYRD